MELCLPKCTLLVGGGGVVVVVEAVRAKEAALGITVATEGTVVMGVPVGTDDYIEGALAAHVGGLLLDIAALDYFTLHGQWTLLRMCVNQRPVYLQRLLQLRHGGVAFSRFDKAVTAKVLDVMGVLLRGERELVLEHVDALRCLPLQTTRVRECSMRSAVRALSVARCLAVGRGTTAPVSGSPLMWLVSTLASGTLPSTYPRSIELATASSVGGTGASDAVKETGNCSMPHCARMMSPIRPSLSAWAVKKRAMLSRQRYNAFTRVDARAMARMGGEGRRGQRARPAGPSIVR
jgi:hypothetical protein